MRQALVLLAAFSCVCGTIPWSTAAAETATTPVYRGLNACRDVRLDHQGVLSLLAGASATASALRRLRVTPAASKAYEFASDVIEHTDFDMVLESPLAKTLPDGTHAFSLSGGNSSGDYVLDYHRATAAALPTSGFLAFAAELDVRADNDPVPNEELGYGIAVRAEADSGEFNHRSLGRLLAGILQILAPRNLRLLTAGPTSRPLVNARLTRELAETLPKSTALAERYLTLEPNADIQGCGAGEVTHLTTRLTLDIDALRKDHPILGRYIEAMAQKFSIRAVVTYRLQSGLTLAVVKVDSTLYRASLDFKTAGGKIIPFDEGGRLYPQQALDPAVVTDLATVAVIDLEGATLGLRFTAAGVKFASTFHDGPVATLEGKLVAMPAPKIEGYALGFVPPWAISAVMIGGSLDDVTTELTQGLLRGSRGQGTFVQAHVDTTNPDANRIVASAGTELVDNFYVTFGMSVADKYLWPRAEVIADFLQLARQLAGATEGDMLRLKTFDTASR